MKRENNRTCLVCGKKYTYCPSCQEDAHKPTWLALYCSENCKKIFMTVTDLHSDDLTVSDAKGILDTCDLSKKNQFNPNLLADIEKIYDEYNQGHGAESVKKVTKPKTKTVNKETSEDSIATNTEITVEVTAETAIETKVKNEAEDEAVTNTDTETTK